MKSRLLRAVVVLAFIGTTVAQDYAIKLFAAENGSLECQYPVQ